MNRAADRPVFTISTETFSWTDVVDAARSYGDWQNLEQTTRYGLACLRRLNASGEELDGQEAADAEARFRYARNLLSGEEMQQWLASWELKLSAWRDYIRRTLLRERWSDELDETFARFPATVEEVDATVWAEAVCSGFLAQAARRLAGDLALSTEAGGSLAGDRAAVFARTAVAAKRARAETATEEALAREVATQGLEWLRVEGDLLELPAEDLAREAALCIREDGRAFAEVAAECGAEPRPLSVYMGELERELAATLLAAREGELVGPVPRNGVFALLFVRTKASATIDDPEVHRKAEERVIFRAVERAVATNVKWHEPL